MKYLLSNLTITEDELEYLEDLIRVYFSLESTEIPQLGIGVSRRYTSTAKELVADAVAADVAGFVSKINSLGLPVTVGEINSSGNQFTVTLKFNGEDINFALE